MKFKVLMLLLFTANTGVCQIFEKANFDIGIRHYHVDPTEAGAGVVTFDFDNDGWVDLYFTGGELSDRLYKNQNGKRFVEITQSAGLRSVLSAKTMGAAVGDINNDGFKELFVTTFEGDHSYLFLNNGDGTFTDISDSAGISADKKWGMSASFADVNLDGYLDIYVGNYAVYAGSPVRGSYSSGDFNRLYINQGDGTFIDQTDSYNVGNETDFTLVSVFTDFDMDNDLDLLVVNDFFGPNFLYQNNYPDPSFTEISLSTNTNAQICGMGTAIGDLDEDGFFEYYLTHKEANILYKNNGAGKRFSDIGGDANVLLPELTSWGTVFFDFNNDTYLDLAVNNGYVVDLNDLEQPNVLFQGTGNGDFERINSSGIEDLTKARGLACADLDNDGDLDLVSAVVSDNFSQLDPYWVYFNRLDEGAKGNYLKVNLTGQTSNRDAYGAWVKLVTNGRTLMREVDGGGSSYLSHHCTTLHFGLGDIESIESLEITWPGGSVQTFSDISANQWIEIEENKSEFRNLGGGDVLTSLDENSMHDFNALEVYPNPVHSILNIQLPTNLQVDEFLSVTIVDIHGKSVESLLVQSIGKAHHLQMDLEKLSTGMYFISINDGRHSVHRKFFKE